MKIKISRPIIKKQKKLAAIILRESEKEVLEYIFDKKLGLGKTTGNKKISTNKVGNKLDIRKFLNAQLLLN